MFDIPKDGVTIVEVAPRDGLQNESRTLTTRQKLHFVEGLGAAGLKRIEVASFVHPGLVPQMADAEKLIEALPQTDKIEYEALVLNWKGFERARNTNIPRINFGFAATNTFNMRNQNTDQKQSLADWRQIAKAAAESGIATTVTISVAFGCPFEGIVSTKELMKLVEQITLTAPDELALADTIGAASPADVVERVTAIRDQDEKVSIRCHFHNSRNIGLANAYAAVQSGVKILDSSLGGLGGCPFAPNATGNIPTEDLVYMLYRMKIETGVSLSDLISEVSWLERHLGKTLPGMLSKAGNFP